MNRPDIKAFLWKYDADLLYMFSRLEKLEKVAEAAKLFLFASDIMHDEYNLRAELVESLKVLETDEQ